MTTARKPGSETAEPHPASDPAAAASGSAGESVEADLDALLAQAQSERDEYLELAQRARADFENYRKRAAREASEAERRGRLRLAEGLVPVVDNLERALLASGIDPVAANASAAGAEQPSEEVSAHEALAQGVALVYHDLRGVLERGGVEAYDPTGDPFDPTWHEAVSTRPQEDVESGVVVETLEKGYRLDGQVLRAARVIVSE